MNYITELQRFIVSHPNDWKELLEQKPYCLKIRERGDLIKFKYNQIDSDPYNPVVQEARGIILEKNTWRIIAFPFTRFYNYGEGCCAPIDWNTARIQEKIDGSIISCFHYDGKWNIATNGMIDAFECELPYVALFGNDVPKTFGDLFIETVRQHSYLEIIKAFAGKTTKLNEQKTYMFELVSRYNKVVIDYPQPDIYHIGTRNNITGEELVEDIGIQHPKEYTFNTIEDVVNNAKSLPYDAEGYVCVDASWNRCKVKGASYLSLHHLKGEEYPSEKRLLQLVVSNEGEELLSYFPEFRDGYEKLESLYEKLIEKVEKEVDFIFSTQYNDRKSFALIAKDMSCPSFLFMVYSHKISANEFRKFTQEMRIESLLNYIKEEE